MTVHGCRVHRQSPPKRSAVGGFAAPAEPELQEEIRWKDRSIRGARHSVGPIGRTKVVWLFGTSVAETILASGLPTAPTGRTYGCKRSDQTVKNFLWHGGRPHMGPGVRRDDVVEFARRSRPIPAAQKPHARRARFGVIWAVESHSQKYFRFARTQITGISIAVSSHLRGVSRSSRTRDEMRWTRAALLTRALCLRTAKSCGPDASTLAPSLADLSSGRRRQESPISGESTKQPLTPLRAGMPGDFGELAVNTRVHFCHFHCAHEAAGALAPGIPVRPLI
jgi:hypothetical protein